jgi:hypothetical protein
VVPVGQLFVVGSGPEESPTSVLAVIGGTKAYAGARGSLTVKGGPDSNKSSLIVRLLSD